MYEDDALPIIGGRERLGIPKLYADISPIKWLPTGKLRCEASRWGHLLFGIEIDTPLIQQSDTVLTAINAQPNVYFGYKFIASPDETPDAAYPMSTISERNVQELSTGRSGRLYFGNPNSEDIAFLARVIDALKTLPVKRILSTSRSIGSSLLRTDLCQRLS